MVAKHARSEVAARLALSTMAPLASLVPLGTLTSHSTIALESGSVRCAMSASGPCSNTYSSASAAARRVASPRSTISCPMRLCRRRMPRSTASALLGLGALDGVRFDGRMFL